jgi:hypothetical protein
MQIYLFYKYVYSKKNNYQKINNLNKNKHDFLLIWTKNQKITQSTLH